MNISRREFLQKFIPLVGVPPEAQKSVWTTVGKIGDFPVDSNVKLDHLGIEVVALPEGFRVVVCRRESSRHQSYRALRLIQGSILQVNLNEEWPESAVLSMMTAEKIDLIHTVEDAHE